MTKKIIWVFAFIGSTIGGFIPSLWGSGMFSFSSIIFSSLGAIVGIYIGFRLNS